MDCDVDVSFSSPDDSTVAFAVAETLVVKFVS